jgi:formylmethanofuran:tetrahydromethanopterin formyltransferase
MTTIEARILPDGRTVLHVQGAKGSQCLKLTEMIVNRLGVAEKVEPTEAMYEQAKDLDRDRDRA